MLLQHSTVLHGLGYSCGQAAAVHPFFWQADTKCSQYCTFHMVTAGNYPQLILCTGVCSYVWLHCIYVCVFYIFTAI